MLLSLLSQLLVCHTDMKHKLAKYPCSNATIAWTVLVGDFTSTIDMTKLKYISEEKFSPYKSVL